jgi:hypothetical protein
MTHFRNNDQLRAWNQRGDVSGGLHRYERIVSALLPVGAWIFLRFSDDTWRSQDGDGDTVAAGPARQIVRALYRFTSVRIISLAARVTGCRAPARP